jgi:putative DNA primase/helicase
VLGRVVGFAQVAEAEHTEKTTAVDTTTGAIVALPVAWVDAHVGEALANALGDMWLYVGLWRRWMYWDGRRWVRDDTEAIHEKARQWIVKVGTAVFAKPGDNGNLLKSIASYKAAGKLEAVVKVARRIKAVDPGIFDTHPHLLNCHNGVVDLRTGELGKHDPALFITKLAGADYCPGAHHHDVDAALACMRPQVAASVQEHLGISASGHTGADHIAVWDGKGDNGKTTLVEATSAALDDYASPIPNELVMHSRREDHPTVKMTLFGLRFAVIEETEEDGGLRLERLKAISGGGEITARPIGGDYYKFSQTHTLTIATNHRPIVNSPEFAVWRRLRLVPFPYRYVHEQQRDTDRAIDTGLRQRLRSGKAQRRAMLAWIVTGAIRAYDGNDTPEVAWCDEILDATNEWRLSEDVIG